MIRWLRDKWYARCRAIDMQILWPALVQQASSLSVAKEAFTVHALNDNAWLALGLTKALRQINNLKG